jgi:hypothetical protein
MGEAPAGLAALEARLRYDLACLNYPPVNWVPPRRQEGRDVADVVLIGGGMCGLVAAFSLLRLGIRNLRILDRGEAGREGPWITYARWRPCARPSTSWGQPPMSLPSLSAPGMRRSLVPRRGSASARCRGRCGCSISSGTGKRLICRSRTASR